MPAAVMIPAPVLDRHRFCGGQQFLEAFYNTHQFPGMIDFLTVSVSLAHQP